MVCPLNNKKIKTDIEIKIRKILCPLRIFHAAPSFRTYTRLKNPSIIERDSP